jgi:hypothetical protein
MRILQCAISDAVSLWSQRRHASERGEQRHEEPRERQAAEDDCVMPTVGGAKRRWNSLVTTRRSMIGNQRVTVAARQLRGTPGQG